MSSFGHFYRKGLATLLLLLCAVRNGGTFVWPGNYTRTFTDTMLIIPSGSNLRTAIDFTLSFTVTRDILPTEYIGARLPRFTRRFQSINESVNVGNVTISDVIVSPSYFYTAAWYETPNVYGSAAQGILPFRDSTLIIKSAINATIEGGSTVLVKVHRENGIGAWCGFASSSIPTTEVVTPSDPFEIFTLFNYGENYTYYSPSVSHNVSTNRNFTLEKNTSSPIDTISGLGPGCDCHGHGKCDFCYEVCQCFDGYGASSDVVSTGASLSVFCDDRVCPAGVAIADIPSTSNEAHNLAECSNHGICDRSTGECQCFEPFTGASCDKLRCPNDCSGHGFCKDMYDLSVDQKMERVHRVDFTYGSAAAMKTSAWDFRTMRACVCESSWSVGFNSGERQLPEYFGPDCSLRHCPSGDDPFTSTDEEDCEGLTQYPGEIYMVGMPGNKCHVDCANRGICDYQTGKCNCFEGSWGPACQYFTNAGSSRAGFVSASNGTYISNVHGN